MRFEVMGPVRIVSDDGADLPIARGRVRQLLSVLLLMQEPVPEHNLCEWLGRDGRGVSGSTVRTHVAALRRSLGPFAGRLRTGPVGYSVAVEPGELDLHRFEELSRTGRHLGRSGEAAAAVEALGEAVALWHDPAFPDVPDVAAVWPRLTELTEERGLVADCMVEARLALGEHRELLPELLGRHTVDPPQERVHQQLMIALYRSGRKAEAYETYHRLRQRLSDSYGADPDPETDRLFSRILRDDLGARPQPSRATAAIGRVRRSTRSRTLVAHRKASIRRVPFF